MDPQTPASPVDRPPAAGTRARLRIESAGIATQQGERVRRIALRILALSAALTAIPFPLGLLFDSTPICMVPMIGLAGVMCSSLALVLGPSVRSVMRPGVVSLSDAAITVYFSEDRRVYPMNEVLEGWLEEPDEVYLRMKGGETLVVKVRSAEEGESLLAAADLSASERVVRMPLSSAASMIPGGRVLSVLGIMGLSPVTIFSGAVAAAMLRDPSKPGNIVGVGLVAGFTVTLAFLIYALVAALRRREVTVGTDGLVVRSTFAREFIPYAQVTQVVPDPDGVRVVCGTKKSVVLPTSDAIALPWHRQSATTPATAAGVKRRDALLDRIQDAMTARQAAGSASANLRHLDRNGRPIAAWRDDLQRLIKAPSLYRGAGFEKSELATLIEDPAAPAERRVGAALALRIADPEETRKRVRIAVSACADDDLRAALESAAEGEVEEGQLEKLRFRA
jgi:hypothetical protein